MFRVDKSKRKGIISLCIMVIAIGVFLYWEGYGREQFTYSAVIVLNQDIEPNQVVKPGMISSIKMDKRNIIGEPVTDPSEIINKEAVCHVPKGLQLCPKFFEKKELNPGKGQYVLEIPADWLYAFPQTLRRGDKVYFHTVVATNKDSGGMTGQPQTQDITPPAPLATDQSADLVLESTVAYVKDSSNREVIDVVPERMDGSAVISKIEIITDDTGYKILKNNYDLGYQFVIMYD